MSTILILSDITGRSRVAVRMMMAVLEARGHEVLALPTALISNTLNLGKSAKLDTTDYMLEALRVWDELGIRYDALCIGYITGIEQAKALAKIADEARARGVLTVLDPILGDGGAMYKSVTQEQAEGFKLLCGHADLILPNVTELCALTDTPYEKMSDLEAVNDAIERLCQGKRSALVKSVPAGDGRGMIAGYDAKTGWPVMVAYDKIEGPSRGGTGDLFGAMVIDALLAGKRLEDAAADAAGHVAAQIAGGEASLLPKI